MPALAPNIAASIPGCVEADAAAQLRAGFERAFGKTLEAVQEWLARPQVSKVRWPERREPMEAMSLTPTRKIVKGARVKRLAQKGS